MRKGRPPKRLGASGADGFWAAAEYAVDCHICGALSDVSWKQKSEDYVMGAQQKCRP